MYKTMHYIIEGIKAGLLIVMWLLIIFGSLVFGGYCIFLAAVGGYWEGWAIIGPLFVLSPLCWIPLAAADFEARL